MINKIDHLGIAVKSIDETAKYYETTLGLKCLGREEVPSQKVKTAFFQAGETCIELLEPTSPDSPVAKFLEAKGEGIHHVAFGTTDILGQLAQAKDAGARDQRGPGPRRPRQTGRLPAPEVHLRRAHRILLPRARREALS